MMIDQVESRAIVANTLSTRTTNSHAVYFENKCTLDIYLGEYFSLSRSLFFTIAVEGESKVCRVNNTLVHFFVCV